MLFHAGVPYLDGGFIGVDVFFVISGFLITGLLVHELDESGRIDIINFYARRARRLLPALAVVLLTTLIGGAIWLTAIGEQQGLAASTIAASAFVANIYFWRTQSHYFAGPSEELPLLHLWTLSVEEQFYLVWPLAMILVAVIASRYGLSVRRWLVTALIATSVISFAACWWLTPSRTSMTFYMTPFRAWEFGVGALLAFAALAPARSALTTAAGTILAVGGIVGIIAASTLFGHRTTFPGAAAALPVLATGAAIAGIRLSPYGFSSYLLASPPIVAVGKVSYSWYLWHWPLLALARADALGETSLVRNLVLVLLALVLAALTYQFVEEPIRRRQTPGLLTWGFALPSRSVMSGLLLMMLTAASAAMLWTGAAWQLDSNPTLRAASLAQLEKGPLPLHCKQFRFPFVELAPAATCYLGATPTAGRAEPAPTVVLWGDSHAHHFIPGLHEWAKRQGIRLLARTMGGCKPHVTKVPDIASAALAARAGACIEFNSAVAASLPVLQAQGTNHVILAARWSVAGNMQNGLGDWENALQARINELKVRGLRVTLFAEVPVPLHAAPACIARRDNDRCSRSRTDIDARRRDVMASLRAIASASGGVSIWDPINTLCTAEICPIQRDGVVLYTDGHHLSVRASRSLAGAIARALNKPIVSAD